MLSAPMEKQPPGSHLQVRKTLHGDLKGWGVQSMQVWACIFGYLPCRQRILEKGLDVFAGQLIAGATALRLSGRSMASQPWFLHLHP